MENSEDLNAIADKLFATSTKEKEDCLVKKAQRVQGVSKQQKEALYRVCGVTEKMVQMAIGYDEVSLEIKQQGEQVNHLVKELTGEMNQFFI